MYLRSLNSQDLSLSYYALLTIISDLEPLLVILITISHDLTHVVSRLVNSRLGGLVLGDFQT